VDNVGFCAISGRVPIWDREDRFDRTQLIATALPHPTLPGHEQELGIVMQCVKVRDGHISAASST
jgi:hypothetical protein